MATFRRTIPNQEVRLRQWAPARVNQLRSFLSHMRTAVDGALSAQVAQTAKRTFSEFLPKIVSQDITTELSYRQIRLVFAPPRGLRKLLFYEAQRSIFSNFNAFEQLQSPEPVFSFVALAPGTEYFFRLRMVSTDGEVGPWSDTLAITSLKARASSLFDNRTLGGVIESDEWTTLLDADHDAVGGVLFYMINFQARVNKFVSPDFNGYWGDMEFRWLEDEEQIGDTYRISTYAVEAISTAIPVFGTEDVFLSSSLDGTVGEGAFSIPGPFNTIRSGTLSQKLHPVLAGTLNIKLQARLFDEHPSPNSWLDNLDFYSRAITNQPISLQLRNFSVFEFVVDS